MLLQVTVVDRTPPRLWSCPINIEVNVAPGTRTAPVLFEASSAVDNREGNMTSLPRFAPAPIIPGFYGVGSTNVTYAFTDRGNNTVVCDFLITVKGA
jgi:hypothetical protein